jgi:predicted HTH transcriptional regulator
MTGSKLKSEFRTLSARAKAILESAETNDVEFKESVSGLESTDIVSFANSEQGGVILIGIRETKGDNGLQRGQIIGCSIGDKEKLKILSKVNSCIPDISVEIFVENLGSKPFFRIEIPSGNDKPYCTSGGTYKIRGDGITQNLNPSQLLNLFVAKESERFLKHYREATNALESDMKDTKDTISTRMGEITGMVEAMKNNISTNLESISQSAKIASGLSDEAVFFSDETFDLVQKLDEKINKMDRELSEMRMAVKALAGKVK